MSTPHPTREPLEIEPSFPQTSAGLSAWETPRLSARRSHRGPSTTLTSWSKNSAAQNLRGKARNHESRTTNPKKCPGQRASHHRAEESGTPDR